MNSSDSSSKKSAHYVEARKSAQARLEKGYDLHFTPAASRDELYERRAAGSGEQWLTDLCKRWLDVLRHG